VAAMPARLRGMSVDAKERVIAIGSPVALLVLLQVLSWLTVLDARFIPSPLTIFEGAVVLIRTG